MQPHDIPDLETKKPILLTGIVKREGQRVAFESRRNTLVPGCALSTNASTANNANTGRASVSTSRSLWGRKQVELYPLAISGLTRFSSVDYPGHIAAVVFCQGCPWRCAYCDSPSLLSATRENIMSWHEIVDWLDIRPGLIEAVVFRGGEPLLQRGLAGAMWQVREMGYRVALYTAGIYPDRLVGVMPFVDWICFDVKAAFCDYQRVTGAENGNAPQRALSFVLASGKPCEIRCTADETLLSIEDMGRMARQISEMGVRRLVLQPRRGSEGKTSPISPKILDVIAPWIPLVEQRASSDVASLR